MVGSLIEAHLFGSMEEDAECVYDQGFFGSTFSIDWPTLVNCTLLHI